MGFEPRHDARAAPREEFPDLDGLDRREVLLRLGGNVFLFRRLLAYASSACRNAAESTREACERGDRGEALRLVHGVRGVLGNLSATEAFRLATVAEQRLLDGRIPLREADLEALEASLTFLLMAIERHFREGLPPEQVRALREPIDAHLVDDLVGLLRAWDADALSLYDTLRPDLERLLGRARGLQLREAMCRVRFDDAAELLMRIDTKR
jgi:HPt (histidine-containing phosphotransfer) domain-containing protein